MTVDPPTGPSSSETIERADIIRPWPAQALHQALELPSAPPEEGDPLPPFWRWMYFLDAQPPSRLGRDGHPAQGVGLIPEIGLPRRMWAGGRIDYRRPLRLGAPATLRSSVAAITRKQGRSGPLCFVTLRHEASDAQGVAEIEEQDLVYRQDAANNISAPKPAAQTAPTDAAWRRDWRADSTLLFRYSALTFNGHRIHYDLDYARAVEGYDGLVVHGPLLATLMLELARAEAPNQTVTRFTFQAISPITHDQGFAVCGKPSENGVDLWVAGPENRLAMRGAAHLAPAP